MGTGLNGYDIDDRRDRVFSFDFDHSGKMDHLVLYRPGTGLFCILRNIGGLYQFAPVYRSGSGIGGYALSDERDLAFAFDYDHSGKLDYIVIYRPGTGVISIVRNKRGDFSPVLQSNGNGIGAFDLRDNRDRAFAFDYDQSGKLDYIAIYRPGTGTIWILKNNGGTFTPVYRQGDPGAGIGSYDLRDNRDQVLAYDYQHTGRRDHLLLYRPGTGTYHIVQNDRGTFQTVQRSNRVRKEVDGAVVTDTNTGIGGYDLASDQDRIYAFDYGRTGKPDHLLMIRVGSNTLWILEHNGAEFRPVYQTSAAAPNIGEHALGFPGDKFAEFDYLHAGVQDHLVVFRGDPSGGAPAGALPLATDVVGRSGAGFASVYQRRRLTVVPYLIGYDDLSSAGMVVRSAELEPGKGFAAEQVGARIVAQVPAPGTPVPAGTTVEVTVSV